MPVITGTGSQEIDVTDTTAYACLKTSNSARYTLSCDPSFQYISVYRLRNGKLEQLKYVEDGKICVLNPNHTYYISARLYSSVLDLDKIKFSVEEVGKIKSTMKLPTSSLKMNTNQSDTNSAGHRNGKKSSCGIYKIQQQQNRKGRDGRTKR